MISALLLTGLLLGPSRTGAVYDARGQRQGYVRESRPGQIDLYDARSRRLGYGRQGTDGRVEFFDKDSRRILTIQPGRPAPRER
jgi:hypothetical protein